MLLTFKTRHTNSLRLSTLSPSFYYPLSSTSPLPSMKGRRAHHHFSPAGSPISDNELAAMGIGGNPSDASSKDQDRFLPIANVSRIMRRSLPANAKISKEAKETVQECVSEFISFITGEASDKCQREKRKTINGEDLLWAMTTLGFKKYVVPLKDYLNKYRETEGEKNWMARPTEDSNPNSYPNPNTSSSQDGGGVNADCLSGYNGGGFYSVEPAVVPPQGFGGAGGRMMGFGEQPKMDVFCMGNGSVRGNGGSPQHGYIHGVHW